MNDQLNISVYEVIGGPSCVTASDGQKIHDRLAAALTNNRHVTLSFRNITDLTPTFMNTAIGQLYGEFERDRIRIFIKIKDFPPEALVLLKLVVDNAIHYFTDMRMRNEG